MARVLLLLPTSTYRAADFLAAARRLGVEVVVGSEVAPTLADSMGDRAVVVPLDDPTAAVAEIARLHARSRLDAIVAVDDQGVLVGAQASAALGLPHNPVEAVRATRDKRLLREVLTRAGLPQPRVDDRAAFPCVVKPTGLAGSRGVIRVDEPAALTSVVDRVRDIAAGGDVLVEDYVPGVEVAVEGLLRAGTLEVLAIFDKPDPLVGPYFEETLYVTPSCLPRESTEAVAESVAESVRALGLVEGPVHAEVRLDGACPVVIEVAARSIGGLCARTLRFGAAVRLEDLILRHALGMPAPEIRRGAGASGVMMLPIARAGVLRSVAGVDRARAIAGVVGIEITIPLGRPVRPLPEGDRYLGFVFARGDSPDDVEHALRAAHEALVIVIT